VRSGPRHFPVREKAVVILASVKALGHSPAPDGVDYRRANGVATDRFSAQLWLSFRWVVATSV
jgi:hypothetical protein